MNLEKQYPILVKLLSVFRRFATKNLSGDCGGISGSGDRRTLSDRRQTFHSQRHRVAERG